MSEGNKRRSSMIKAPLLHKNAADTLRGAMLTTLESRRAPVLEVDPQPLHQCILPDMIISFPQAYAHNIISISTQSTNVPISDRHP